MGKSFLRERLEVEIGTDIVNTSENSLFYSLGQGGSLLLEQNGAYTKNIQPETYPFYLIRFVAAGTVNVLKDNAGTDLIPFFFTGSAPVDVPAGVDLFTNIARPFQELELDGEAQAVIYFV